MSVVEQVEGEKDFAAFVGHAHASLRDGDQMRIEVNGKHFDLKSSDSERVLELIELVASGRPFFLNTPPDTITTGQAADLLGISRPTLVKLIDDGRLPAERVGTHRRLRSSDVIEFQQQAQAGFSEGLNKLAALTEEFGLQDS